MQHLKPWRVNDCPPGVFYWQWWLLPALLLVVATLASAQGEKEMYRLTFVDKGTADFGEQSLLYQTTLSLFHQEAITRRQLNGKTPILDSLDQPVASEYLDSLLAKGIVPVLIRNWTNSVVVELDSQQVTTLTLAPYLSAIQPVREVHYQTLALTPCTPPNPSPSSIMHTLINATPLHDAGIYGNDVRYGLIDVGFRWQGMSSLHHVRVDDTYDFIQGDSVVKAQGNESPDQEGHGSIVLSVAAGWLQDTLIGTAPSATYLLAKTENLNYERRIEEEAYCAAVEWLERKGAWVISSSVGYYDFDSTEQASQPWMMSGHTTFASQAVNRAVSLGVIAVSAVGNSGRKPNSIIIPSEADSVIAVGAANALGAAWPSSSFGTTPSGRVRPDLACLGVAVQSQGPDGEVRPVSGTSLAAPQIGGACALLRELFPEATSYLVREHLFNSCYVADSVGEFLGRGIPNITMAARSIGSSLPPGIGPAAIVNRGGKQTVLATVYTFDVLKVSLIISDSGSTDTVAGEPIDSLWYAFSIPDFRFTSDTLRGYIEAVNNQGSRRFPYSQEKFDIPRTGSNIPCGMRLPSTLTNVADEVNNTVGHPLIIVPNPTSPNRTITISGITSPHTIRIIQTSTGAEVAQLSVTLHSTEWQAHLPSLERGHYLVVVYGNDSIQASSLIINH